MTSSCVIVGAGGQARVVLSLLQHSTAAGKFVPAFVADIAPRGAGEKILGVPVLPLPADLDEIKSSGIAAAVIAIGSNEMRRRYFDLFGAAGFALPNVISQQAILDESVQLGVGNVVAHGAHIGPCARIGSNNIINTNANVEHECEVGSHCHLGPGSILCGRVRVEDGCMVGAGAIVIENRRLSREVFVGAGAVVVADAVRPASQLRGVPAREVAGQ